MLDIFILISLLYSIILIVLHKQFASSTYKKASGHSFLKTIFDKGTLGEFKVYRILEKFRMHSKIMTNLYIPDSKGKTTEIDMLFITRWGIFVIESKNYSGWIYGSQNQRLWTKTFKNGKKYKFFNPIWQNSGHINALKEVLNISGEDLYHSLIVFSNKSTLKKVSYTKEAVSVLYRTQLFKMIKKVISTQPMVMTEGDVDVIYNRLKDYQSADEAIKKNHVLGIKKDKVS